MLPARDRPSGVPAALGTRGVTQRSVAGAEVLGGVSISGVMASAYSSGWTTSVPRWLLTVVVVVPRAFRPTQILPEAGLRPPKTVVRETDPLVTPLAEAAP